MSYVSLLGDEPQLLSRSWRSKTRLTAAVRRTSGNRKDTTGLIVFHSGSITIKLSRIFTLSHCLFYPYVTVSTNNGGYIYICLEFLVWYSVDKISWSRMHFGIHFCQLRWHGLLLYIPDILKFMRGQLETGNILSFNVLPLIALHQSKLSLLND